MTRDDLLLQIGEKVDLTKSKWEFGCLIEGLDRLEVDDKEMERSYFYDKIAPRILGGKLSGPDLLEMLDQSINCIAMGKDIAPFVGENGNVLAKVSHLLPQFDDDPHIKQSTFHQVSNIIAINKLINEHIYEQDNYVENYICSEFHNGVRDAGYQMPLQGWKLHISATDLDDYRKLLETALPEFKKEGVMYKVVAPESFESFAEGSQAGKNITVYLSDAFDVSKFSPKLQNMLSEQSTFVEGELSLGGRMFARYGKFREHPHDQLVCPYGGSTYDERGICAPSWVGTLDPQQILSFAAICEERLNITGDYKEYAQSMFTMNSIVPNNYLYHALEINPQDMKGVHELLSTYTRPHGGGSAIYELDGHAYVMLHENDKRFKEVLEREGIKYIRPDWDFKCNMYFINPEHESLAREMVGQDRDDVSLEHFQDGSVAVCMDSLIKEGTWDFVRNANFEGFGIQVTDVVYGQDHLFAIERNQIKAQHIDLTTPSFPEQEDFEWD